jgi:hypothetical protein
MTDRRWSDLFTFLSRALLVIGSIVAAVVGEWVLALREKPPQQTVNQPQPTSQSDTVVLPPIPTAIVLTPMGAGQGGSVYAPPPVPTAMIIEVPQFTGGYVQATPSPPK